MEIKSGITGSKCYSTWQAVTFHPTKDRLSIYNRDAQLSRCNRERGMETISNITKKYFYSLVSM